ncbi:MAG: CBS domain-containing protein [Flavobacterium sp.]|nr:MAG: CBS domain-containing protein [Flavobacterium sp.]
MGEQKVNRSFSEEKKALFIKNLLDDVRALEQMLENGQIEKGITRIGAEQEFCLVTKDWRPATNNEEILAKVNDPHFTTELARYNLEINLDPIELKGDCFTKVEAQLKDMLTKGVKVSEENDTKMILTGILPTITKTHLSLDYITPNPRYYALNEMLIGLRRSNFQLHLKGVDELSIAHDSVLFEACNTSFQLHLQIDPDDFISSFNWSQAIAGPILSICCNSPLLLGRELWDETRIALFRQSIDTRNISEALKDQSPRVAFGDNWAKGTAVDIYKENISKFKIILSRELDENSLEVLAEGKTPKLRALNLHSGTIYPWNRACYGVGNGKAHLRIENRYIPSGPSVLDEMANFAFWVGVMRGRPKKFDDMASVMDFREAKSNFVKAARSGRSAVMCWEGKQYSAKKLIKKVFLPMAYDGLRSEGIAEADIERLLNVIEKRLKGNTGSTWMISNYRRLNNSMKKDKALRLITKSIYLNQQKGIPVHKWPDADENDVLKEASHLVGHIMSTMLFTVKDTDLANLATSIMEWNNIHHVPVENDENELCGLLTWSHASKYHEEKDNSWYLVKDIMEKKVISVEATTPIKDAIQIMKTYEIGCLPVLQNKELIGIITVHDVRPYDHD